MKTNRTNKNLHQWLCVVLMAVAFGVQGNSVFREYFEKKEKGGDFTHTFEFVTQKNGCKLTINSIGPKEIIQQIFELDTDMVTRHWTYKNTAGQSDFQAELKDQVIVLRGLFEGKAVSKNFKINKYPWNQVFAIGMEAFSASGIKKTKFWAIGTQGPGKMKITTFNVTNLGEETILFNGQNITATKLRFSLPGLLAMFWKGDYWYRKKDNYFILYREKGKAEDTDAFMELIIKND